MAASIDIKADVLKAKLAGNRVDTNNCGESVLQALVLDAPTMTTDAKGGKTMPDINFVQKIASIAQTVTVIGTALFAVFKFRLYRLWQPTQKSEMECSARPTASKHIVFEAEYKVFNTGERPLRIRRVILKLCGVKQVNGSHLIPDIDNLLASPTVIGEDERKANSNEHFKQIGELGYINKGSYSSFTLRCCLKELPDVIFILGEFSWQGGTRTFSEMWVNQLYSSLPMVQRTAASA